MRTGFTLIELLVVMLLLSMLLSVMAPQGAKILQSYHALADRKNQDIEKKKAFFDAFLMENKAVIHQYEHP